MTDRTVLRLLVGILTAVLLALGVAFVGVGELAPPPDGGAALVAAGAMALVAGAVLATGFVLLSRAEASERRRRETGSRAVATVLRADWDPGVRIGGRIGLELTVHLPACGAVTRRMLASPADDFAEGDQVVVRYDPAAPANFEPLTAVRTPADRRPWG